MRENKANKEKLEEIIHEKKKCKNLQKGCY